MKNNIRLHKTIVNPKSLKLNYFSGRHLSEQEFDIMQLYVDERCEKLLQARIPGIVEGLHLSINNDTESSINSSGTIRVQPGVAVGGDGRAIAVFLPIDIDWPSLIHVFLERTSSKNTTPQRVHGYYYLSINRQVFLVDESKDSSPCNRNEHNPLRDSRQETFASLDLEPITDIKSVMDMEKVRAANHIIANQVGLKGSPFNDDTGAIPIALIKVDDEKLVWVDELAGRYLSEEDSTNLCLLRHWQSHIEETGFNIPANPSISLAQNIGVNYLPAAGIFPDNLVGDIAGKQDPENPELWLNPKLKFAPQDLQIELLPIPANTAKGVVMSEMNRGKVDLVHFQQDRIRLMVAVDEQDYNPNLMDLPQIDHDLLNDLVDRYNTIASHHNQWANQYQHLYYGLDNVNFYTYVDQADDEAGGDKNIKNQQLFDSTYKTQGPDNVFLPQSSELLKSWGIPEAQPTPETPNEYLGHLVNESDTSSRPYSQPASKRSPTQAVDVEIERNSTPNNGLYRQQADMQLHIEYLERNLEGSFDLLNEFNDFISVQRQQLDSITVSFASLAGGVAGDGSGLNLMRWTSHVNFQSNDNTTVTEEG